jgi:hypothetical protein
LPELATMIDPTSTIACPTAASLDAWAGRRWNDGLQLDRLCELDELSVRTRNSVYRIVAIVPHGGDILVQGGRFFPELTRVRLAGCSLGGAFLKQGGIYVGFRMEIQRGPETKVTPGTPGIAGRIVTLVTSNVQSIEIVSGGRTH